MSAAHILQLILLSLLWGISFMMMRVAAPEFGPVVMVCTRLLLALVCLLPLLWFKRVFHEIKRHYKPILVVGLLNSLIPFYLFGYASLVFTSAYTSIINATTSLWVAIIGILVFNVRLTLAACGGLMIGFLGVVVMVWRDLVDYNSTAALINTDSFLLALAAGLLATLSYGINSFYVQRRLNGINGLTLTGGSLLLVAIVALPITIYYWPSQWPSVQAWLAVACMAIFSTVWGLLLYIKLLREIGPNKTVTVTYLIPLVGMTAGGVFLDEPITEQMLIGCLMILLGVGLSTGLLNVKWLSRFSR